MVFRKRPKDFVPIVSPSVPIYVLETQEETRNNQIIKKEVVVSVNESEFFERHPIPKEEFTLAQELAAGVSIKDAPTAGLLDSSDNLDYEENDYAEEKILTALEKEENK